MNDRTQTVTPEQTRIEDRLHELPQRWQSASFRGKCAAEVAAGLVADIQRILGADNAYFYHKNVHGRWTPSDPPYRRAEMEATACTCVLDQATTKDQGLCVLDAMKHPRFGTEPEVQRYNIQSILCVPMPAEPPYAAAIYADSRTACTWDERTVESLRDVARFAALYQRIAVLEERHRANERLVQAGEVTLKLSHSVKNVLQMICGAAEVIDFGLNTNEIDRVVRSWNILKPNLDRMRKLTLDMLDYSKERRIERGPCDFNDVIKGAVETLKAQLKQKQARLTMRIDKRIPTMEIDGERIHEMALNFILNALDVVEDKGGRVYVETTYLDEERMAQVRFADNGPGLSDQMREKIFTPFVSEKNKFGTGLGMAIARQIVDQHDGRIDIETEKGNGTTFIVSLPVGPVQQ